MPAELSPREAARIAKLSYVAYDSDDTADYMRNAATQIPNGFTPLGDVIRGRTGISLVTNSCVMFSRDGTRGREKVISIRGTQEGQDWLSNINIGMVPGPTATPVHAGFLFAYRSMKNEIRGNLDRATQTVHVVGHSLGGAQATLMAMECQSAGYNTYLYTFGSPRVGGLPFGIDATTRLGRRYYRVYDRGDPVPMIPLFPFLHAPLGRNRSYICGPDRDSISVDNHSITSSYGAHCTATWQGMRDAYQDSRLNFGPAYWLERAGERTRIPGGATALRLLGRALEGLLTSIGSTIQTAIQAPLTVIDVIAYALIRAAEGVAAIRDMLGRWVSLAMRWLGRGQAHNRDTPITVRFLRYVLNLFFGALSMVARRAIDRLRDRVV